jgi:hypothetical protein
VDAWRAERTAFEARPREQVIVREYACVMRVLDSEFMVLPVDERSREGETCLARLNQTMIEGTIVRPLIHLYHNSFTPGIIPTEHKSLFLLRTEYIVKIGIVQYEK